MKSNSGKFLGMCIVLSLLMGFVSPTTTQAQMDAAQLFITPTLGMPGADLAISGINLPAGTELFIRIHNDAFPDGQTLAPASTGRTGSFSLHTSLPMLPAGDYQVSAIDASNDTLYASTALTVLPRLALQVDPLGGPPGAQVNFTVSGLVLGELRLDYDGVPIYGPALVDESVHSGIFSIPHDRPEVLGDPVTLAAVNLVAGQVAGAVEINFQSEPASDAPVYAFSSLEIPSTELLPGQVFSMTGQITPPPPDPMTRFELKAMWRTPEGLSFPISMQAADIYTDGSFQAVAHLPSLFAGDPASGENAGEVGLVLIDHQNASPGTYQAFPFEPGKAPPPAFQVLVKGTDGVLVDDALVDMRGFFMPGLNGVYIEEKPKETITYSASEAYDMQNQIGVMLAGLGMFEKTNPLTCSSGAGFGKTNMSGLYTPDIGYETVAWMGSKTFLDDNLKKYEWYQSMEITFPVSVNALYEGYGEKDKDGLLAVSTRMVRYSRFTNKFYDAYTDQELDTNPLVFELPPIPPGTIIDLPIRPELDGAQPLNFYAHYLGGAPATAFGNFLSFADQSKFPAGMLSGSLKVKFDYNPSLYGVLDPSHIRLKIHGKQYPFAATGYTSGDCLATTYEAVIDDILRFPSGVNTGSLEVKDVSGHITKHTLLLAFKQPPSWIGSQNLAERKVFITQNLQEIHYQLFGNQVPPGASSSEVSANVPKVGKMENSVGIQSEYTQFIYLSGKASGFYDGGFGTTVLNEGSGESLDNNAPPEVIIIPKETKTVANTGKIPLFRDTWGVPPIASATIGADMWLKATVSSEGKIQFSTTGAATYEMHITPTGTVEVDAWLEASAVFGLVEASAHALPKIQVSIPAHFVNGTLKDTGKCFGYRLDISWQAHLGVCPFCLSESGVKNVIPPDHVPKNEPGCSDPSSSSAQTGTALNAGPEAVSSSPPPHSHPSLATDNLGQVLAVYALAGGGIASRSYNGLNWAPALTVTANPSARSPEVAFFAPNNAVAVWTQSGLTPAGSQAADFYTRARNQHLAYAVWNGTSWSAPKNLTLPTTGDGGIALAGCPSNQAGCPAGGEATAVWVHDAAGDLNQRQFRLYFAQYKNGAWTSIQAVDPGSSATDSQPTAAYHGGAPAVAWVRDADRDLASLNDMRLAYRDLTPSASIQIPAALPSGVVEPSLAFDAQQMKLAFTVAEDADFLTGNQRRLYTAALGCPSGCSWTVQPLSDYHGRAILAEGPALLLDGTGKGILLYRALGYRSPQGGAYQPMPGDPPGVIQGLGAIASLPVDFSGASFYPQYAPAAAGLNWQVAGIFNPLTNQVLFAQGQWDPGSPVAALAANTFGPESALSTSEAAQDGIVLTALAAAPDYTIVSAEPETDFPMDGDSFSLNLLVANTGPAADGGPDLEIAASWDGPPGVGVQAGTLVASPPDPGQEDEYAIDLSAPQGPEFPHSLFIRLNPAGSIPESNYGNNNLVIDFAGLPSPQVETVRLKRGSSLVALGWAPLDDRRIAGYRVYRTELGAGDPVPVGSTPTNGFVDPTALLGHSYTYYVTTYTNDGVESALSEPVQVIAGPGWQAYLPMVSR